MFLTFHLKKMNQFDLIRHSCPVYLLTEFTKMIKRSRYGRISIFEFQMIDRELTEKEQKNLRNLSTRADITPISFTNEYHFGDFKGNPHEMVEKYFDAFINYADWGSRWIMLKIPKEQIVAGLAEQYCIGESFSISETDDAFIFEFMLETDDYDDFYEGCDVVMRSLISLRSDLIRGDYRALYLGWLLTAETGELPLDENEPPVPHGFGNLNISLKRLAEFLQIDSDLIRAAAEMSGSQKQSADETGELKDWIKNLSMEDKDSLLFRLTNDKNCRIGNELYNKFKKCLSKTAPDIKDENLRSVELLLQRGETITNERKEKDKAEKEERQRRLAAEQKRKREIYLDNLMKNELKSWELIDVLINTRQPTKYDDAVTLLSDLSELAEKNDAVEQFQAKLLNLKEQHIRKTTLIRRMEEAGLFLYNKLIEPKL